MSGGASPALIPSIFDPRVDTVPHLIECIDLDLSIRVRRMATIMLGTDHSDPRAVPVFERLLNEDERKLRLHARRGLERYAQIGVTSTNR